MNVIQPGDHVIIAWPASYSVPGTREHMEKEVRNFPESIKDGFGGAVPFSMSWMPVASPDSDPYVLFVIRNPKP